MLLPNMMNYLNRKNHRLGLGNAAIRSGHIDYSMMRFAITGPTNGSLVVSWREECWICCGKKVMGYGFFAVAHGNLGSFCGAFVSC